jgi:hypothetical protein
MDDLGLHERLRGGDLRRLLVARVERHRAKPSQSEDRGHRRYPRLQVLHELLPPGMK